MAGTAHIKVYLEVSKQRTFAGALEWPGWIRSGKTEDASLEALVEYGPRYGRALGRRKLGFAAPKDASKLQVAERLKGDVTTDFGAPSITPAADKRPLKEAELERQAAILKACWRAFDAAAKAAVGKELRKGPRGGGRELDAIVRHVLDAEVGYLRRLGRTHPKVEGEDTPAEMARVHKETLGGISGLARGEPVPNPRRSGALWTPGYAVRRVAWHALNHAWEIEDRASARGRKGKGD
jgi:hypothetical protein